MHIHLERNKTQLLDRFLESRKELKNTCIHLKVNKRFSETSTMPQKRAGEAQNILGQGTSRQGILRMRYQYVKIEYDQRKELSQLESVHQGVPKILLQQLPVFKWSGGDERSCSVCLTVLSPGDRVKTLPCFDMFHSACIDKWLLAHKSCPVCRYSVC